MDGCEETESEERFYSEKIGFSNKPVIDHRIFTGLPIGDRDPSDWPCVVILLAKLTAHLNDSLETTTTSLSVIHIAWPYSEITA